MPVGDPHPFDDTLIVVFESDTDVPTEFTFNGETMINFGLVRIYGPRPEEP